MSISQPVRTLTAEVARKIAAGEVIDRPNAIVRELMDNAIDSGADAITVEITGGGIEKVRIVDNGCGMTKDDLQTCARPHSTSKIASETDLLRLTTLGFRGEALSSIAAVCRLSICSGGYKMRASVTEDHIIEKTAVLDGTIVQAEGLFENFPARRVFLKRPASEGTLCKTTFVEKTLPCPEKSFRFISDGTIRLDLPPGQTLTGRFVKAMELKEPPELFYEISGTADTSGHPDWSFKVVIGEPGVSRPNKKNILIFVNGRRITDYSLVQAVEYGGQGYFPNGTFPVAAAFIQVNPALVDFNIHPAKREVRFKDISELHHGLSTAIKRFFASYTNKTMKQTLKERIQPEEHPLFKPEMPSEYSPAHLAEMALSDETGTHTENSFSSAEKNSLREKNSPFFGEGSTVRDSAPDEAQRKSTADFSVPSGNRARFFENRPASEKYTISHTSFSAVPKELIAADSTGKSDSDEEQKRSAQTQKIIALVDNAIAAYNSKPPQNRQSAQETISAADNSKPDETIQQTIKSSRQESSAFNAETNEFHFLGSALGTFILAEKGNALYIIDKHAAHERYIFDSIMKNQSSSQHLLIPYIIETKNADEDEYLSSIQEELAKIGFECTNTGGGRWEFTALQERWSGTERELEHALLDKKVAPKDLIYSIAAMTACKAAVKDGWILDDNAAEQIARDALELADPHCPHGRPVYTVITREQLFSLVRRT